MKFALGDWEFRKVGDERWRPAQVPGCVHTDLHRNREIADPFWGDNERGLQWIEEEDWEYLCVFEGSSFGSGACYLVAEGLDTSTEVFLNGRLLARVDNMFQTHRWRIDRRLVAGQNEIRIRFESPMKYIRRTRCSHRPFDHQDWIGGCTRIRKQQCSFGWDWGPRFATSGIWRPIYIENDEPKVGSFRVEQRFPGKDADLRVHFSARPSHETRLVLLKDGEVMARGASNARLKVRDAARWWPRGEGDQTLYELRVELVDGRRVLAADQRRIGLRTIQLRQRKDAGGKSFEFVVNGRAIFAKGANWIPAHAFVAGLQRRDYEPILASAVAANMNMLRVWGGGIYEHDSFYDLCDELGLLVWQDFMFACTLYPGDARFLKSVREEAIQQTRRLRHHACLALWCGNNEIEVLPQNRSLMEAKARYQKAYRDLFQRLLPEIVRRETPDVPYHRSSPLGSQTSGVSHSIRRQWGDAHNWDVFHSKAPLETYESSNHRFVSEFGMQALPGAEMVATFCRREEWNISTAAMEAHQKHPSGNEVILDYVLRRYPFPGDYAALAYLSQLNQAEAMRVAIEHFRRCAPHTMGAIYWQYNDCWPAASWSGLEFGGRWRALQYEIKRLFAPVLLCPQIRSRVSRGPGNLLRRENGEVDLWMACDDVAGTAGTLEWSARDWSGREWLSGTVPIKLKHLESRNWGRVDVNDALHGGLAVETCYLRFRYTPRTGECLETIRFLIPPRYLQLPSAKPVWEIASLTEREASLRIHAPAFLHAICLEGSAGIGRISENFFDLEKGGTKIVKVELTRAFSEKQLRRRLRIHSLVEAGSAS